MLRIERWKEASTHEFMKIDFYLLRFCIFSLFFWLFYHGTVCATSEQASQWVHRYQYLIVVGISTGKQPGTDTRVGHRFLLCFPDGTQSENVRESCDWTTQTGNQWTWPEANHSLFFSGESEQQQQGVLSLQLGVTARFHPLHLCQGEWKLLNCIFYLVYLLHESEFLLLT